MFIQRMAETQLCLNVQSNVDNTPSFLDRCNTETKGYTSLQSLVKCLDHKVLHQVQYAVKQSCVRLRTPCL